jgi:biopolymer transport protein ExbD
MRIDLGERDEEPEIGLIALIDCIFFLLMFFMVATSFKQQVGQKQAKDLAIELPASDAALEPAGATDAALAIGVDAQGRFAIDGQPLSVQALHDRLREVARANPNRAVRIEGDRRTAYQHIVHVLDLCAFEGLTRVTLKTRS